jgi:hypothetical protein
VAVRTSKLKRLPPSVRVTRGAARRVPKDPGATAKRTLFMENHGCFLRVTRFTHILLLKIAV